MALAERSGMSPASDSTTTPSRGLPASKEKRELQRAEPPKPNQTHNKLERPVLVQQSTRESVRPRYGGKGVPALRPTAVGATSSADPGSFDAHMSDSDTDDLDEEHDNDFVEVDQTAGTTKPATATPTAKTLLVEAQQENSTSMQYLMKKVQAHDHGRGQQKATGG